jgi:uncharacterized protein GlcG (DUF336 family)
MRGCSERQRRLLNRTRPNGRFTHARFCRTRAGQSATRTAALFRKPSKALEDSIHAGRVAAVTSGFVQMAGGLPLNVNGEIIGAIGVSSAQSDWDAQIAAAGASALVGFPYRQ